MTAFWVHGIYYELTLYMDLWNNEIVAHALSAKRGDSADERDARMFGWAHKRQTLERI